MLDFTSPKSFVIVLLLLTIFCLNVQGEVYVTPEVSILEERPPKGSDRISVKDNRIHVVGLVGENIVMECRVFQKPQKDARLLWQYSKTVANTNDEIINDGFMSRDSSKWKIGMGKQTDSIRLEILSLTADYAGVYSCVCYYSGEAEAARVDRMLDVFELPRIVLYQSSHDLLVQEGEKSVLRCYAEGIPKPSITWRRIGGQSSVIRNFGEVKVGNMITFSKTESGDAGVYLCEALNNIGVTLWKIKLDVNHKPLIEIFPPTGLAQQKPGCNYEILCKVRANPIPQSNQVLWVSSTAGTLVTDDKRIKVRYLVAANNQIFYSLSFEPLLAADLDATYACTASTELGTGTGQVVIKASDIAQPGRTGFIDCSSCKLSNISLFSALFLVLVVLLIQ